MNNYANNVFEAIDTIINQRLSKLSFDRTITCKIVEEVKDKPNTYWVSNDSMRFQAISQDGKKYGKKEEVFVLIPNGEYSNEKIITGSRIDNSKDGYNKMKYISTREQFVEYNTIQLFTDELSINATRNNQKSSVSKTINITKCKYNIPIEYIGLSFQLSTLDLFKANEKNGQYAISIGFWNNNEKLHGTINDVSEYTIASKELYGNPYAFSSSFSHFMLLPFKINDITQINKITIDLSQNGEFDYSGNSAIKIKLSNVSLSFGFEKDSSNIDKSKLILEKNQTLDYKITDVDLSRNIYLQYVQGNQVYNYINNNLPNDYSIDWFKYTLNHKDNSYFKVSGESEDEWKAQDINLNLWNWEKLTNTNNNKFIYSLDLNKDAPKEQYKAIIWKRNEIIDEDAGKTVYTYDFTEVEGITFNNTAVSEASGAVGEGNGLRLELDQGNTGVYNLYEPNGTMISGSTSKIYNIRAVFIENYTIDDIAENGIVWTFPQSNTMIEKYESEEETNKAAKLEAQYKIKSQYLPGAMNNRIWCTITLKSGKILSASLTLQFGEYSTQGTEYSLNIDFVGNQHFLFMQNAPYDAVQVKATLQDTTGREIPISDNEVTWSWLFSPNDLYDQHIRRFIRFHDDTLGIEYSSKTNIEKEKISEITAGSNIKLTYTYQGQPYWITKEQNVYYDDPTYDSEITDTYRSKGYNFSILKAELKNYGLVNGLTTNLTAYLPIPLSYKDNGAGIETVYYIGGPTKILYGSDNTTYYSNKENYELYNEQGEALADKITRASVDYIKTWNIRLFDKNNNAESVPEIKDDIKNEDENTYKYRLIPMAYAPNFNRLPMICIRGGYGARTVDANGKASYDLSGKTCWLQPLLILQNKWEIDALNAWNGTGFGINDKSGVIMSSVLTAGVKEKDAEGKDVFTGVVAGAIKELGTSAYHGSGIYGFKQGVNRFRLTDDGDFWVGSDDNNRIKFIDGKLDIKADSIQLSASDIVLSANTPYGNTTLGNVLQINEEEISGMVSSEVTSQTSNKLDNSSSGAVTEGCGWSVTRDAFTINSYLNSSPTKRFEIGKNGLYINTPNFTVNGNSVSIKGKIQAQEGLATTWKIYSENSYTNLYGYLGYIDTIGGGKSFGLYATRDLHIETTNVLRLRSGSNVRIKAQDNTGKIILERLFSSNHADKDSGVYIRVGSPSYPGGVWGRLTVFSGSDLSEGSQVPLYLEVVSNGMVETY